MKPKYLAIFLSLLLCGCSSGEEKLTPTTEPEPVYNGANTLPQGDHDYDQGIVDFFNKYGTIILYEFDENEIYWMRSASLPRSVYDADTDTSTKGYFDTPADANYVGPQLQLLYETLSQFPEDVLKKNLPRRIFLVDSFINVTTEGPGTPQERPHNIVAFYLGPDYFLITGGGQRIETTMTGAEKKLITGGIFSHFFKPLMEAGNYPVPAEFAALTSYATMGSPSWTNMYRQYGCLYWTHRTAAADWNKYVELITTLPYSEWMLLDPANPTKTETQLSRGYMDPYLDTENKVRIKYKFVLDYFQDTYGLDLFGVLNEGTFVF